MERSSSEFCRTGLSTSELQNLDLELDCSGSLAIRKFCET